MDKSVLPKIQVTQLPSKFKSYPKDATIFYYPYTYGDLLSFNQSKMSEAGNVEFILKGIEVSPNFSLTYFDFLYIALLRRLSTFDSSKFDIKYACSKCGNVVTKTVTFEEVEFDDMDVEDLPIVVTYKDKDLTIMPLTISQYLDLAKKGKHNNKIAILAKTITNVPFDEAMNIISTATGEFAEILDEVNTILYHGIKPFSFECDNEVDGEKCGQVESVSIDRPEVLVLPFRRDSKAIRNKIRFGIQQNS